MDQKQARSLAEAVIFEYRLDEGDVAVIVDEESIEKPWGWVFFYQSRRFLETDDLSSSLVGNSPIIIDARTGAATETGTAHPVQHYIAEYERNHGLM